MTSETPFRVSRYVTEPPRFGAMPPDVHNALHLGIMLNGFFEACISGFRFPVMPGQVWFTAPWEPHFTICSGQGSEVILFTLDIEFLGKIGFSPGIDWILPFLVPPLERPVVREECLKSKVLSFGNEVRNLLEIDDKTERERLLWLKLHEILTVLTFESGFRRENDAASRCSILARILPALERVWSGNESAIRLDEAAGICNLGKSRFSALFKSVMGDSFGTFVARRRLCGAAAAVKSSNLPFKSIAVERGFFDESHFYRAFRKAFGCTPKEYRASSSRTE